MKAALFLLAGFVSAVCTAQTSEENKETLGILGEWESFQSGYRMKIAFDKDGSGEFAGEGMNYTARDGKLNMTMFSRRLLTYTYAISTKNLTITGGDLRTPLVFTKIESNTNFLLDKTLIGEWSADNEVFEFRSDGKCLFNGAEMDYRVVNGNIIASTAQSTMMMPYKVKKDKLMVTIQGVEFTYKKVKSDK
jgi:hypothetical protein